MSIRKTINQFAYALVSIGSVVFLSYLPRLALAEPPAVAVLYPEIREPFRGIFLNIVRGIEDGTKTAVKQQSIRDGDDVSALKAWLERENVQVVIALGTSGVTLAQQLPESVRVVVGAVLIPPDEHARGHRGITLAPDPDILFERLRTLAPKVKRVTVVYNPQHNGWLIERARGSARSRGLVLDALPADDLRAAAALYRDTLSKLEPGAEAIWLPQDEATVDDGAVLRLILKEAWDRGFIVVSSNPAHARKGALMALYPNNVALGRSLAEIAMNRVHALENPGIVPLRDVVVAVNARTAEHLGIDLNSADKQALELIYPSP